MFGYFEVRFRTASLNVRSASIFLDGVVRKSKETVGVKESGFVGHFPRLRRETFARRSNKAGNQGGSREAGRCCRSLIVEIPARLKWG